MFTSYLASENPTVLPGYRQLAMLMSRELAVLARCYPRLIFASLTRRLLSVGC